jgi:acyl-CoA dehydrogenase
MSLVMFVIVVLICLGLAILRASVLSWLLAVVVLVFIVASESRISPEALQIVYIVLGGGVAIIGVPQLRRPLVSGPLLRLFRKLLPPISTTEQEALSAGSVCWEGELFNGYPDWHKLLETPPAALSGAEQSFLDNEVEQLCALLNDWEITHQRRDLPPQVWQFLKDKGFFGLIIPTAYGGLGFSAQAHSAIIVKVASRSTSAAVTVMVPNSLGPAELLLHYGTTEQKDKYLRKLATGQEVPCFALTGPEAGSDAAAIPDSGVVCYAAFGGNKKVLGIRLNWEKRYITLAPVATLLGLAFKLHDPKRLLGGEVERGITLALIPANLPGVEIGRRHNPLDAAFMNGPTLGRDVFIPLDYVIGGVERVGHGWRMLMECLAAGRAISLPANATGGMKLAARTGGAYARVRRQFKLPIGKFEGVEEPLARIAAHTYLIDSARRLTASLVDQGKRPAVVSAIVKYHATERGRGVINDAMDVHGGKGVCLGPSNYLGRSYQQAPIAITVEGANILTRSLMIFGQGVLRSHPYVLKEMSAAQMSNPAQALEQFDLALFGHISFAMSNAARTLLFALLDGLLIPAPLGRETTRYYQKLTRYASAFALMSDAVMLAFGGGLKRREKISGRMGDVLSQLYLASAALKRFEDDGRPADDLPVLDWCIRDALYRVQQALDGVLANLPFYLRWPLRGLVFPYGLRVRPPSDEAGHVLAGLLMQPGAFRDRLTAGIYLPSDADEAVAALEAALESSLRCEALQGRLEAASREGRIGAHQELERIREAQKKGVINAGEGALLERDYALRRQVIMVDDFQGEACRTEQSLM